MNQAVLNYCHSVRHFNPKIHHLLIPNNHFGHVEPEFAQFYSLRLCFFFEEMKLEQANIFDAQIKQTFLSYLLLILNQSSLVFSFNAIPCPLSLF